MRYPCAGEQPATERFEKELGIKTHDTTDDNMFSLEVVRCLGACGLAPVLKINKDPRVRIKTDQVPGIIQELRNAAE